MVNLEKTLNETLVNIFNNILKTEEKFLKKEGLSNLSISEMHTIDAIAKSSIKTMSKIAKRLRITVGTLTITVNNLVKKGYVERKRNLKDRRVVNIDLTNNGILAYEKHQCFHNEMVEDTMKGLSIEEVTILVRALQNLNEYFKIKYEIY